MSPMPIVTQPTLYRNHPASFREGNGDSVGDAHGKLAALLVDGLLLPQAFMIAGLEDSTSGEKKVQHSPLACRLTAALGSVKAVRHANGCTRSRAFEAPQSI